MRTILREIIPSLSPAPMHDHAAGIAPTPFGLLGRWLLQHHERPQALAIAAAAIVISTGLRQLLDELLPPGFPFLTFFPAVLFTLLFAGVRAGLFVAVACGLIAWFVFLPPKYSFAADPGTAMAMAFYVLITGVQIFFFAATVAALRVLTETQRRTYEVARSRELMFSELQHRVSNNLATVAALLRMQSSRSTQPEVKKALGEATQRIQTVSRLQRSLHSPDLQDVDASVFLRDLAHDTLEASHLDRRPAVSVQAEALKLTRDQAVPLGLITSELLMNAVEHGVDQTGNAAIDLTLSSSDAGAARRILLAVRDNGPGLPDGFDLSSAPSLGLSIARQFAEQLGGALTMQTAAGGGTISRLEFPA